MPATYDLGGKLSNIKNGLGLNLRVCVLWSTHQTSDLIIFWLPVVGRLQASCWSVTSQKKSYSLIRNDNDDNLIEQR